MKTFPITFSSDFAKVILRSKFNYLLFCNPNNKIETKIENRWEIINNKPNGPIIMIGQLETRNNNHISYLLHFFLTRAKFYCTFY